MPSHNAKGRSKRTPGGYVIIQGYMMDCEAWKALTPYAWCLYMVLKRRHRKHNGGKSNNGDISLSRREAARETGFSESAVGNAFRDLIAKGFVKITRDSAFNMKEARAREYALTEFGVGDKMPTKEFVQWMPNEKQNTGLPDIPGGSGKHTRAPNLRVVKGGKKAPTGLPGTPDNTTNGSARHTTSNTSRERAADARDWLVLNGQIGD